MCGIILFAALASACTHDGDLRRFYSENDGKALRRLPSYIVPENAFISISDPDSMISRRRTRYGGRT